MKWLFRTQENVDKKSKTFIATTTVDYTNTLAEFLDRRTIDKLIDKLVDVWIEEHGKELLEKITPEEVEQRIKQTLAERVLKA